LKFERTGLQSLDLTLDIDEMMVGFLITDYILHAETNQNAAVSLKIILEVALEEEKKDKLAQVGFTP
jgi:hypothetical protein